jgi:hypothetical protein
MAAAGEGYAGRDKRLFSHTQKEIPMREYAASSNGHIVGPAAHKLASVLNSLQPVMGHVHKTVDGGHTVVAWFAAHRKLLQQAADIQTHPNATPLSDRDTLSVRAACAIADAGELNMGDSYVFTGVDSSAPAQVLEHVCCFVL